MEVNAMKEPTTRLAVLVAWALLIGPRLATGDAAGAAPASITTPDRVESRIGALEFEDGAPSRATLEAVYDHVDFTHAYEAFVNTLSGVSIHAIRKGLQSIGGAGTGARPCPGRAGS
jgi:hypothetical protein